MLENYVLIGTSKAEIEALVRYLAVELGPRGIRVNAVSAGVVDTGALEHFPNKEEMLRFGAANPAGRIVAPDDVACAVAFLCSGDAEMVRGAIERQLAAPGVQVIITTGGTGITSRDSTYETVSAMLDKRLDGFGELFRMLSFQEIGPAAMMSRACAGIAAGLRNTG